MKLHEIEETLHTLERRHPGLNEVMLVTLLRAGGWEEKHVEEARTLFRTSPGVPPPRFEEPSLQEHSQLPEQITRVVVEKDAAPPQTVHVPETKPVVEPVQHAEPEKPAEQKMMEHIKEPATIQNQQAASLPALEDVPLLVPTVDEHHLLTEHVAPEPLAPVPASVVVLTEVKREERQSLITPLPSADDKREDLPHNLPLRPFETSEHIWPFSRYRDVFYGEPEIPQPLSEEPATEIKTTNVFVTPQATARMEEKPKEAIVQKKEEQAVVEAVRVVEKPAPLPEIKTQAAYQPPLQPPIRQAVPPTAAHTGDEKLVVMACVMLLILLLLLGYMYSNGRL